MAVRTLCEMGFQPVTSCFLSWIREAWFGLLKKRDGLEAHPTKAKAISHLKMAISPNRISSAVSQVDPSLAETASERRVLRH
jgi:hypothetical protein